MCTDSKCASQVLRCIGCGAPHPSPRNIPGEVTACTDCVDRTDVDPVFDLLLGLAVLANKPLYLVQREVAPRAAAGGR
jgi:hypothetical protein